MIAKRWMAGPAVVLLAAACAKPAAPAATTPVPTAAQSDSARAAADSAAAAARRDSLAAAARADSLGRAAAAQAQADSVKAQLARAAADTAPVSAASGLAPADSAALADPIHFAYNAAEVQRDDQARLDHKLPVLAAHPRLEIRIAGNCDERGSDEYNLALGERRAAAAKRYLVAHGVAAARIGIVSYGEEHPLDPGHNEGAWAKNRRDDFVVSRGAR